MASQNYAECERRVLLSEGGYTNDPRDPGGPTNWGITLEDARLHWKPHATAEDVRAMPKSVAVRIYKEKYWDAMRCDELASGVDYAVFDYGVNSGIGRASRVYRALSAHETDPVRLVNAICAERLAFLHRLPTWSHFGPGWGSRVARVKAYADHLATEAQGIAPPHPENTAPAAKAYETAEMASEHTQTVTVDPQSASVVRLNEVPATQVAPEPKAHWWKPLAAFGLGGGGAADWLSQVNDWTSQASFAKENLENITASGAFLWTVHHPVILVPVLAIGAGAWLWEDHKKTKRLIEELKCSRPSPSS